MTDTVSVEEQEPVETQVVETEVVETNEEQVNEPVQEQSVPLSTHIKERRKRQEAEQRIIERDQELKMFREHQLKQMQQPKTMEDDGSQYEPLTKADEARIKQDLAREADEKSREKDEKKWIRQNPEKAEIINEKLTNFLKQRPNLAAAIEAAPNRYEEAWELMDKLSPKQKAALQAPPAAKKVAPNSPSGIPKAAAMNQAVDVMTMTDSEFAQWRAAQRKRR